LVDKKFAILGFFLFILLILSVLPAEAATSTYKAGDTIKIRIPTSGMGIAALEKPKFIRYNLVDPFGKVVYEEDHVLMYVHEIIGMGVAYEFYDEYQLRVSSFSTPGEWKIRGQIFNEFLWVINLPNIGILEYKFNVREVSFFENLLAPWYNTIDMGPLGGRANFVLPIHPYLIAIAIGIIIAIVIIVKVVVNLAVPLNGKKKNGEKK